MVARNGPHAIDEDGQAARRDGRSLMAPPRRVAGQDGKARPVQVPLTEQEYVALEAWCERHGTGKAEAFRQAARKAGMLGRVKGKR